MPANVIRVYPASGAVALLPLTPANNWTPTILFCGGSDMPADYWGNYSFPNFNTWLYPASKDCQRLTPEPEDGSTPAYEQDDDMLEGRSMGQFISLPDGTLLVINGAQNGTAGYAQATGMTPRFEDMPYGESLASGPIGTPAIYNPNLPRGNRWSNTGLSTTKIARLYHSSAILLPDASVMIAGSNPNIDVNLTTIFPTTYTAEVFYPPYFSASIRPSPSGVPKQLSYGGAYFNITVPATSYNGSSNAAAANTTVVLSRGGFTTHAMNMGQRHLQLNNTYYVNADGSYVLHVAQVPPKPNIFQPGPALLFVVVNGIPSNGTIVIVGSGNIETQPISDPSNLPPTVQSNAAHGSGSPGNSNDNSSSGPRVGVMVASVFGAIAGIALILTTSYMCIVRRRKEALRRHPAAAYAMGPPRGRLYEENTYRQSDSSAFVPLQGNHSTTWGASNVSLHSSPYDRDDYSRRLSGTDYDSRDPEGVQRIDGHRS